MPYFEAYIRDESKSFALHLNVSLLSAADIAYINDKMTRDFPIAVLVRHSKDWIVIHVDDLNNLLDELPLDFPEPLSKAIDRALEMGARWLIFDDRGVA